MRRETLQIPNWRGAPLTIAVASDLHVGSPWCGMRKLRFNSAHADAVVLLGDYVIQGVARAAQAARPARDAVRRDEAAARST